MSDLVYDLESYVDRHGLVHVLAALELMCGEKSAFVDSCESIGNPDPQLARIWDKCGRAIYKAALVAEQLP